MDKGQGAKNFALSHSTFVVSAIARKQLLSSVNGQLRRFDLVSGCIFLFTDLQCFFEKFQSVSIMFLIKKVFAGVLVNEGFERRCSDIGFNRDDQLAKKTIGF